MELNKAFHNNISKTGLYQETSKTLFSSCLDLIEWMAWRINHESRTILNFEDKHVSNYQDPVLNLLYHFKEAQVKVTPEWLKNKIKSIYFLSIMKGWWSEGQFKEKPWPVEWRTSKFRKSIQSRVILLERIFGRKYASSFPEKWIPIIHQVITHGSTLN